MKRTISHLLFNDFTRKMPSMLNYLTGASTPTHIVARFYLHAAKFRSLAWKLVFVVGHLLSWKHFYCPFWSSNGLRNSFTIWIDINYQRSFSFSTDLHNRNKLYQHLQPALHHQQRINISTFDCFDYNHRNSCVHKMLPKMHITFRFYYQHIYWFAQLKYENRYLTANNNHKMYITTHTRIYSCIRFMTQIAIERWQMR